MPVAKIQRDRLDDALVGLFDGTALDRKPTLAPQLVTTGSDGCGHLALLSVGEVWAPNDTTVALALYAQSGTTVNLRSQRRGLLFVVFNGVCYHIQLHVRSTGVETIGGSQLALFDTEVTVVWRDEVDYARVTSGVTFELPRQVEVVQRWEKTVDMLRAFVSR